MKHSSLTCFKAYDIRGEIGVNINETIAHNIGQAVAQHFNAKTIIVGFDARETSPKFAAAVSLGARNSGADIINIGLAGTEEMYWAVSEFNACAGIEVTASHNPINYNGMKIVKSSSQPLDDESDFQIIKKLAETEHWNVSEHVGREFDYRNAARDAYVKKVTQFVDVEALKPLKIVINSGNGAAGPTFDAIANYLSSQNAPLEFVRVHHDPDASFPNGIPNPLLKENHAATSDVVKHTGADFGVAFDGDFDRCFFFDEKGEFIPGEYLVGLLAEVFLSKERGAKIVHDPRVVWNTQDVVKSNDGHAIQSKTGHAFIKKTMRETNAIYGGEMSAHHYFRDFAFCDSGMIPWLILSELVSSSGKSLGDLVKDRYAAFPSSGEINFHVESAEKAIKKVLSIYSPKVVSLDTTDGISLEFSDWRFNLRSSNTEPLMRLNIETCGDSEILSEKTKEIFNAIKS